MTPAEAARRFAIATGAFTRGDQRGARSALLGVPDSLRTGQAWHLLALCEQGDGNAAAAVAAYIAGAGVEPRNAPLLGDHANLLVELGERDAALVVYRRAVAADPRFVDGWYNLGLAAHAAGRHDEARAALGRAVTLEPGRAAAHHALGLVWRDLSRGAEAAAALDAALALQPGNARALHARARLAGERGGDARPWFARARAAAPSDVSVVLGEAGADFAAGQAADAEAKLEAALAVLPDWLDGHQALAEIRLQGGTGRAAFRSYDTVLARLPAHLGLWQTRLAQMGCAGLWLDVLDDLPRARLATGKPQTFALLSATAADETGDPAAAAAAFDQLAANPDPGVQLARVRHLLRTRRLDAAAALAVTLTRGPFAVTAWAYLEAAWRLLGDDRADWLNDAPGLVSVVDVDVADLAEVAEVLRGLHIAKAAPGNQSVRGGTQTDGPLFLRAEGAIARLRTAVDGAVADYIAGLPPPQPGHPTLGRARGGFRYAGSWSVRLSGAGHHVSHVHDRGWLSSACYIALPDGLGDDGAGWLELGAPPSELGLGLAPVRVIEPRPGRLVLFPSTMWHATRPFATGERLTVAFDVVPTA